MLKQVGYNDYLIDSMDLVNAAFYGVDKKATPDIVMRPGAVDIPEGKGH